MNVLIIGGNVFVGRYVTDALLSAGHAVTHFNRGITAPPRAGIETIKGDRKKDLELLGDRVWDAVVDTCAYVPQDVQLSIERLKDRAGQYVLISTVSVYDYDRIEDGTPLDELAPTAALAPGADDAAVTPETYGALKARCEEIVLEAFGSQRSALVRCGLMVGPHDRSDRFTYWVARYARGGRMLAPAGSDEPMQFVDVRDVAAFVVRAIENGTSGLFNVTGLPGTTTFGRLFERIAAVTDARPEVVWLDRETIARSGLAQWKDIPLWVDDAKEMRKLHAVVIERALSAGLTLRPLDETIRDTLAWAQTRPSDYVMKHGMTLEQEAEALGPATAGPSESKPET